ncbi:hypothetical protein [Acidocella sp.]|uniref:hypothetical protein n=1 Tax=Acidocella sp. TaxID=50710 RepID=UPI001C28DE1A|nr:hypothetical protein [Acidocella sp.]MBU6397284.1 hypothetical protein [Rhodospirillales bacterium]
MEKKFWVGAKLVIFLISIFYVASMDESVSNFDIFDAALISFVTFIALSVWLFLHRKRMGAGLDTSITLSGPFWPMTYHPFQFWTLASMTAICGGIANISATLVSGRGSNIMGFVSLFMGVAVAVAIAIQIRLTKP